MDMMLLGETVRSPGAQTNYGFWMPAGGNDGIGGVEVFYCSAAVFKIEVETKSSDQDDSSSTTVSGSMAPTAGATITSYSTLIANAKDLVRYKVTASGAGVVHLQLAQPLWQPN